MIRSIRTRRPIAHRVLAAASSTAKALAYRTLSGVIAVLVDAGQLIRTGDFLQRIGGQDLPDGQQAWFGRHVAKAYRNTHGGDTVRVWARHRTTGKWIHVYVYNPGDDALHTALHTYKATRHLVAETYARCA
jgi:hypothetical protein